MSTGLELKVQYSEHLEYITVVFPAFVLFLLYN